MIMKYVINQLFGRFCTFLNTLAPAELDAPWRILIFYPALLFHVGKSIEVRAFVERFREIKRNFPLRPHHRKFRLILSDLSLSVTTTETDISLASFNMSERERMINDSIFFQPLLARFLFLFLLWLLLPLQCFTKPFEVLLEKKLPSLQMQYCGKKE